MIRATSRTAGNGSRLLAPVAGLAVALIAVACSSGSASDSSNASSGPTGGGSQVTSLQVTTLGLCNEISVYWARDKGIFEKNGLQVSLVKSSGGAAGLAALEGGSVDVAFTNPLSALLAVKTGVDLTWIADAYGYPTSQADATAGLFVKQDSPIKSPKDLGSKKIATNELGGIGQMTVTEFIKQAGGDPSKVGWVSLPFGQLVSSVESGTVDAASISLQAAEGKDLRSLGDPHVAATHGIPTPYAGYVMKGSSADKDHGVGQAFYDSLVEADEAINDPANVDEKFKLEGQGCGQDPASLKGIKENPYDASVDMKGLRQLTDLLVQQGLASGLPNIDEFVADFAKKKS